MNDLLTTRQLQDLLQVDRTTIYRMLNDGRLAGFKVGGQWRFPRQEIEAWLEIQRDRLQRVTPATGNQIQPTADILPFHCIQPIQDIFAEAADVGSITTRVDGQPITEISNSCVFCRLILDSEKGLEGCIGSWRALGQRPEPEPRGFQCHAGLLYARGRVEISDQFVAMVFAGQFLNEPLPGEKWDERVSQLATAYDLDRQALRAAVPSVRLYDADEVQRILGLLQMVTGTFVHIGQERIDLLGRLRRIAEITAIDV